jgi:hypothetical protein
MTGFFRVSVILIFICLNLAFAKSDSEVRDEIQTYLLDRHPSTTPQWWQSLGPRTPQILIEVYGKTDRVDHKMKLLQGVAAFDQPAVGEFLKKQATDSGVTDVLRGSAIRGLALSQGAQEIDFIAQFLKDEDAQIRLAAAESLQSIESPKSKSILEVYRSEEKESWILSRLDGEFPDPRSRVRERSSTRASVLPSKKPSKEPSKVEEEKVGVLGTWVGYWMSPRSGSDIGLKSEAAVLTFEASKSSAIQGSLTLKKKGSSRKFRIPEAILQQPKLSGKIQEELSPTTQSEGVSFEGDVFFQVNSQFLQLRVPKWGAVLVVRRAPHFSVCDSKRKC